MHGVAGPGSLEDLGQRTGHPPPNSEDEEGVVEVATGEEYRHEKTQFASLELVVGGVLACVVRALGNGDVEALGRAAALLQGNGALLLLHVHG